MRTTVRIDDDILVAARILASERGVSLGVALSELARRGLRPSAREGNLPVFDIDPEAPVITQRLVREALEDA